MSRFYCDSRYGTTKVLQLGHATTVGGTVATAAELTRTTVMENTVLKDWQLRLTTGGTGAGPSITIGYSVDGTGAFVPIGTQAFGTHADGAMVDCSLTETKINAGDDILIQSVAGTVASTVVVEYFDVENVEWFVADQVT